MSLAESNSPKSSKYKFWKDFRELNPIPETIKCEYFCSATLIIEERAQEYKRESGPYLDAVRSVHLPESRKRLGTLQKKYDLFKQAFHKDNDKLDQADRINRLKRNAFQIVSSFDNTVIDLLKKVKLRGDEKYAKKKFRDVKVNAQKIKKFALQNFKIAIDELESQVASAVTTIKPIRGCVSCVSVDMYHYTAHSKAMDEKYNAPGVYSLNRKIQNLIDAAIPRDSLATKIETGDGAIIIFSEHGSKDFSEAANDACEFCRNLLKANARENKGKATANRMYFRTGICSGVIDGEHFQVPKKKIGECRAGGMPISIAVRLQTAAVPGQIVVCQRTMKAFKNENRGWFGEEISVHGKGHERKGIPAHCCQFTPQPRVKKRKKRN